MSDEVSESVDLWDVLEEAEQTVERWPPWQQRYDADIYYDDEGSSDLPPARRQAGGPQHYTGSATVH